MNSTPAEQPDTASDPESVFRSVLDADLRPVITAATPAQMRAALDAAAGHLCSRIHRDIGDFAAYGPDQRPSWAVCQTGNAMRAGFHITHAVTQAIAGSYLTVMGFDPAAAITEPRYHADVITPAMTAASQTRLRAVLLALAAHAGATTTDADQNATLAAGIADGIPADLWDIGTGTITAIRLYQHAALVEAAQVLCALWDTLAPGPAPVLLPFPADTSQALSPN